MEGGELVNLNYNNLTDIPNKLLEENLFRKKLEKLYLKQNLIVQLNPRVAAFKALKELYLHSNRLTTIPDEIGELESLEQLNVDQNSLTSLNPAVGKLVKLRIISFSRNNIKSIPNSIWSCGSLESIDGSCNQIEHLDADIGMSANLQRLNLDCNKLTTLPPQLAGLENVKELSFSGNNLESIPVAFERLAHLKSLLLDSNPRLSHIPGNILSSKSLAYLGIVKCGTNVSNMNQFHELIPNFEFHIRTSVPPLQELAARLIAQRILIFNGKYVWQTKTIADRLPIPISVSNLLSPSGFCTCGYPVMELREGCVVHLKGRYGLTMNRLPERTYLKPLEVNGENDPGVILSYTFCSSSCLSTFFINYTIWTYHNSSIL